MGYNNGFPSGGYQPDYPRYQQDYSGYQRYQYYPNPSQTPVMQSANTNANSINGMIWVQGISGAKSYLIAPNSTVVLWDSEDSVIYLKSADASGMPTMKIIDYTVRDDQRNHNQSPVAPINDEQFATKEDINLLRAEIDKFRNRIDSLSINRKEQRKDNNRNESSVSANDGKR